MGSSYCSDETASSGHKSGDINKQRRKPTYPCALCQQTFPAKWRLRRHLRERHSKQEEAILCEHCRSKLKNKSSLEKHIRTGCCVKAQDKPYSCQSCSKRYRSIKYLKHHNRDVHSAEGASSKKIRSCLEKLAQALPERKPPISNVPNFYI